MRRHNGLPTKSISQESGKAPPTSIIDTVRPCITLTNRDYVYEAVNRAYCHGHGKTPQDIVGKTVAEVWGQEKFETLIRKNFDACFAGQEVRDEDWVDFAAIGRRYCEIVYSPYAPDGKSITHAAVVTYDITDRKRMEEALAKSERRFKALSEASLEAIVFIEEGIIVDANRALSSLFGYEDGEVRGRKAVDFIAPDRRSHTEERMEKGAEGAYETVGLRKGGTTFPIEVNAREFHGEGKHLRISAVRDLTEWKRVETKLKTYQEQLEKLVEERTGALVHTNALLQKSEKKYKDIFENAMEGIFQTTLQGRIISANPVLATMYGFDTPEEMVTLMVDLWNEPYIDPRKRATLLRLLRKPGIARNFEVEILSRGGRTRWASMNVRAVKGEKGRAAYLEGTVQDITEAKRIHMALEESEKRLEANSRSLEEMNTALKVLLKQREEDKRDMEQVFLSNVKELVLPYVERLKRSKLDSDQAAYCAIAETNLKEIVAPFLKKVQFFNFTPRELEIASLIKEGKTTKEIAEILHVCTASVALHRYNIRRKLGLNKKGSNLRSQLAALSRYKS
jgi:PAS domain S-box-containing protein